MSAQSAALVRHTSSPSIPHESTTLEQIQVKLVEALHEMQKDTYEKCGVLGNVAGSCILARRHGMLLSPDFSDARLK